MGPPMSKVWWGKEGPTTAETETGTLVMGKGRLTKMPQCTGADRGSWNTGVSVLLPDRGFRKHFCPGQILTVTSRVTRCKSQLFIKFSETQSLVSQYLTPTGVPEMADFTRNSWSILAVERGRAAVFQLCPQTEPPWDESVWPPRARTAPKESTEDLVSSYSPHRTHPDSPHTTTWGGGFVQQTDTGLLIYLHA